MKLQITNFHHSLVRNYKIDKYLKKLINDRLNNFLLNYKYKDEIFIHYIILTCLAYLIHLVLIC